MLFQLRGFKAVMQPNLTKQQQLKRLRELFKISRQRYLETGGNPRRAADESYLTAQERQEAKSLGEQIFDDDYIESYLKHLVFGFKASDRYMM